MNTTPTLEMLHPKTLTIDVNVRKDAALTPAFGPASKNTVSSSPWSPTARTTAPCTS
jgi:hypothetical protein